MRFLNLYNLNRASAIRVEIIETHFNDAELDLKNVFQSDALALKQVFQKNGFIFQCLLSAGFHKCL